MIPIQIEEDELYNMLIDRLEQWTQDRKIINLFGKMYENYIDNGVFDYMKINIAEIVDNDWVNYCSIIAEGDPEFDDLKKIYDAQGIGDCSCESEYYGFIEAVDNEDKPKIFLVRCK